MSYKIYLVENQGETKLTLRFHETQELWNALIPKCNALVAKPIPAKSRIIPNQWRKSKKARGNGANGGKYPVPPLHLVPLPSVGRRRRN